MKRKLLFLLALGALIALLCCGTALADAPSFTYQPTVGDVSADGEKLPVSWEVNFEPVRTEIIQNGEVTETLDAGVTAHDFAESTDAYTVRVYHAEDGWIESDPFQVDIAAITFLLGHGSDQGPYYAYVRRGSSYSLPKCMFYSPSQSGWLGHFVDWRVGMDGTHHPVGYTFPVYQDTEVKAYWETGYYTITFHPPMAGMYPEACQEDIDPETGLLTYRWPYLNYASSNDDPVIRPLMGQLPNWSGYGPAPVHLYWDLTDTLDSNYKQPKWPDGSPNHDYIAYERTAPKAYGFAPLAVGYVTHVEAYPVFGWRGYASYNANGGSGYMKSDVFEVVMGESGEKNYAVRENSYTAPSRSGGNAPSYYRFDGWLLHGEPCAPGTVMTVYGSDLLFVARWKDQYNEPGFYLYGLFDGEAYACSETAEEVGDLFTQAGEDVWTARVSSETGCHVAVKYYNGYYNESQWYHASGSGSVAALTPGTATGDAANMLEIPAGSYLLTLEGDGSGGYTLRYEEAAPLCTITGELTQWDAAEMALSSDGTYIYTAEIDPNMSWSGTFEFYFTLNDVDYTAAATVFDAVQGLALAPMNSEEYWGNIRLAASGIAAYTFTLDPSDMTLSVTNDLTSPGAFLAGFMGDWPQRMVNLSEGEIAGGEIASEPPLAPYAFPDGTTLWASANVYPEDVTSFSIAQNGERFGASAVTPGTATALSAGGTCPLSPDVWEEGGLYDFYYCPETHQLLVQFRPYTAHLTLFSWCEEDQAPPVEAWYSEEPEETAFVIAPAEGPYTQGSPITVTAPAIPGYQFIAWYSGQVETWWNQTQGDHYSFWYTGEGPVCSDPVFTFDIADSENLVAVYAPGSAACTVIFDALGGSAVEPQTVPGGEAAAAPADPMKIGAVFTGWYTDADCAAESLYDFAVPVTADITLYAGWLTPEPSGILRLPAMLTTLEADAFSGIAAEAVIIPGTVTAISGNPFSGSSVRYIYGIPGSATETLAASVEDLTFIPIDDAWLTSH